jgi:hypothetical protein
MDEPEGCMYAALTGTASLRGAQELHQVNQIVYSFTRAVGYNNK